MPRKHNSRIADRRNAVALPFSQTEEFDCGGQTIETFVAVPRHPADSRQGQTGASTLHIARPEFRGFPAACYRREQRRFQRCVFLLSVLLTALWTSPSLSQTARAAHTPSYVGRWYVEDPAVCKGSGGNTEGLVVYTPGRMEAYENLCDIIRTRATGPRTEITMRCRAEGTTSVEKETTEIVNGRLRVTFSINGKTRSFDYRRCP